MAISETAQKNHDELFPGHVSTLKVTDPELIEVFDNFAFDEVLRHTELDTRTRLMVQLAALIGCQGLSEYRVFDFIHATNEVLTERGIQLPLPGQATTDPGNRAERGREVQEQIVGADRVARMYAAAADALPFQLFLSDNCFGDYLTRTGISLPERELLTFAFLTALGGCDAQGKSHVAANLNVGNTRRTLLGVLVVLVPFIGEIAQTHGKSPAQVMLRWHLQEGRSVIPKSTKPRRIAENFDVFDFDLNRGELSRIDGLDTGKRGGPDPSDITLESFGREIPEA